MMDHSCAHKPLVCVIMPAYNAQRYIARAIRSVQAQTVTDWRLLVVDDGSADATVRIVEKLVKEDSRIFLHRNPQNIGVAKSRNGALEMCHGEFVAFLDSDDVWHPQKLPLQLELFRKTGADLIYTSYTMVGGPEDHIRKTFSVPERTDFAGLLRENVIGCSTVMLSPETAQRFRFPENVYHEDYVLWLEILRAGGRAEGIDQVLVDYLLHADSRAGNKGRAAIQRWRIYRRYLGLPLGKSLVYFTSYALAGLRKYSK